MLRVWPEDGRTPVVDLDATGHVALWKARSPGASEPLRQMTTSDNSTTSSPGTGGNRVSAARDWLSDRADTSLARLALLWFRRYLEASRTGRGGGDLCDAVGVPDCAGHHRGLQPGHGKRECVLGAPDLAHEPRRADGESRPRPVRHHVEQPPSLVHDRGFPSGARDRTAVPGRVRAPGGSTWARRPTRCCSRSGSSSSAG